MDFDGIPHEELNAHERFIKLGFRLAQVLDDRIIFVKEANYQCISFFQHRKEYSATKGVTVEEHDAITKQLDEYGWLKANGSD